jgi:hypothetical protein
MDPYRALLDQFTPQECTNYLRHAGYGAKSTESAQGLALVSARPCKSEGREASDRTYLVDLIWFKWL